MFNSYVQLPDPGWYLIVPSRNQNYPSWWMKTSLANAAALDPRLSPLFEWRIAYPAIPIRLSSMIPVRSSQLKQNWSPIWIFSMLSMLVFVQRARCFNTGSGPWQFGALAVPVLRIPHGMGSLPTQKCGWENHGWDPWFSPEFDPTSSTKPPKWMWHVKTKKKKTMISHMFPTKHQTQPKKTLRPSEWRKPRVSGGMSMRFPVKWWILKYGKLHLGRCCIQTFKILQLKNLPKHVLGE